MLPAANVPWSFSLSYQLQSTPVWIEFLRGTWCPNCKKRMAQLEPLKDEIEKLGMLVYVAAEKRSGMFDPVEYFEKHPSPYPFLLDEDRAVTKKYGVYHRLSFDAINIARPASFIVGKDGKIRYLYVGASQIDRAPVNEVLAAMRELQP